MNEALVKNFNSVVPADGITYNLGDFSLSEKYVEKYLPRLNGTHIFLKGNHDKCWSNKEKALKAQERYLKYGFQSIHERLIIDVPELGGEVLLTHMPRSNSADPRYDKDRPNDWNIKRGWMLHGHSHEKTFVDFELRQLNVGVDQWNYKPVSLEQIIEFIQMHENSSLKKLAKNDLYQI